MKLKDYRSNEKLQISKTPSTGILSPTNMKIEIIRSSDQPTGMILAIRINLSKYSISLQMEVFLDWLDQIKCIFEYKEMPDDKKMKIVILKLTSQTSTWWQ